MDSPKNKSTRKLKEPVRVRTKKLSDGSESFYLDIYVNGKRSYEFLKMYLLPEVNTKVKEQNRVTRAAVEAIKSQRIIDITNSKAGIRRSVGWQKLLLSDWLATYLANQERKGIRNISGLKSVIRIVSQYGKKSRTRMGDIDKRWALGFIDWLIHDYAQGGKTGEQKTALSKGSAAYYTSQLTAALNAAVRAEILGENPFMLLSSDEKIKKPESNRQFLTIEEVRKLIATGCRLAIVKQAYMFSCYCALRISDVRSLRWKNLICNDGSYMLSIVMKKTSAPIYVPLSKNAMLWFPERGSADEEALIFDGLPTLPTINKVLKGWVKDAGIEKRITYHTSRHTFGTMMMTVGADLYTTSKLMGHADVRITQIYAKIVDSKKIEAVNMVDKMFEGQ